jgi:hypothetical protein
MLFIINSDWEFIGGPDCEDDFSDFDTLIAMAEAAVQIFADTGQKLVPYIATATSGFAVNEDDSDDVVRSRLFTIYGDDINYSKIEFSDKRMPFITNEIPDSTIDAGLRKLLDVIKNLNN